MEQKTTDFQRVGGLAAWGQALCYLTGFTLFVFLLDFPSSLENPIEAIAYLIDNKALILVTMAVIYVFAALILLVLVLALHEHLASEPTPQMQVATTVGIVWAGVVVASGMIFLVGAESVIALYSHDPERAATVWLAIGVVQNGLGGGTEFLGGVWIFAISWVAIRTGRLTQPLNSLGLLIGLIGILSIVPAWETLVELFGLSQIVWFIWVGRVLRR